MKTWEDLTKWEKEKLDMFVKISTLWQPIYTVIALVCMIGIMIAIPLIYTSILSLIIAGFVILGYVGYMALCMFVFMTRDKKTLYLMFGIESISKDVFDISKEDLRKVKKGLKKVK